MAPARTLPTSDTPPHWHSALELAASRGAAVQLTVIHGGRTVLNDSVRCTRDALGWLFSAGKPFTSLPVHRLAATGALHTHRTGLPTAGPYARAVLTMQDAESSARRVASARRRHRHFGQRPDGSPDGAASFSAVAAYQPVDGSLRALPGGPVVARIVNRRSVRQAELSRPSSDGGRDAWALLETRWGTGVQLGGTGCWCPLGTTSTPRAVGHNGSDVCLGWADPDLELAVGLITDRASGSAADKRVLIKLSDLILSLAANAPGAAEAPGA